MHQMIRRTPKTGMADQRAASMYPNGLRVACCGRVGHERPSTPGLRRGCEVGTLPPCDTGKAIP